MPYAALPLLAAIAIGQFGVHAAHQAEGAEGAETELGRARFFARGPEGNECKLRCVRFRVDASRNGGVVRTQVVLEIAADEDGPLEARGDSRTLACGGCE